MAPDETAATLTVTATIDGKKGSATVSVTETGVETDPVDAVEISGVSTITAGNEITLTAAMTKSSAPVTDTTGLDIVWEVSGASNTSDTAITKQSNPLQAKLAAGAGETGSSGKLTVTVTVSKGGKQLATDTFEVTVS